MRFKQIAHICFVLCIAAILGIAASGCDDMGVYSDTQEYYDSFDDIVLINGVSKSSKEYSVEKYFYNEESRDKFLKDEDGTYNGIEHGEYVYVAIPFLSDIDVDSIALYMQSLNDVTIYINVFVTDEIPTNWKPLENNEIGTDSSSEETVEESTEESGEESVEETVEGTVEESTEESAAETVEESGEETTTEKSEYDDPDPQTRVGEIILHLKKDNWDSFVLDTFNVNGVAQNSIQIKDGQIILLQIRNNSGVRIFDQEKQVFVDPQTGIELQSAKITMTNLLIRALGIENETETQGGE